MTLRVVAFAGPTRPIGELLAASSGSGSDLPTEFLVFPNPTWELADCTLVTDDASQRAVTAEFRARKIQIVIDYEHQTLEAADKGIQAPAAGWIKDLRADRTGLYATGVEWTEKAAGYLRAREYRYYSPVAFFEADTNRVISLHSVALTNTPRTNKQTPLTARLAASLVAQFNQGTEKEEGIMKKWMVLLAAAVKRAATSTPAELATAFEAVVAALKETGAEAAGTDATVPIAAALGFAEPGQMPGDVLTLLKLPATATTAQVQASILTLAHPADKVDKATYDTVVAAKTALEQQIAAAGATGAIEKLIVANRSRITPAMEPTIREFAKKDLALATAMVAALPEQHPNARGALESIPPPEAEDEANAFVTVGEGQMRKVEPLSAAVVTANKAIMAAAAKAGKPLTYREANEIRKEREAGE
ncbi:MAG: Mu-like prophage FluMu protein [Acidobacteria bacterium]|nr:Mu-like prophage FluMu protein [Acidobacteriota bacterium]